MERSPTALLAPVRISTPPGNSLLSTVLPLSRERRSLTRSRSTSLSSISGSIRCLELRLASFTVGATAIIGPGLMDHVSNPAVAALRAADLRALHQRDALDRRCR